MSDETRERVAKWLWKHEWGRELRDDRALHRSGYLAHADELLALLQPVNDPLAPRSERGELRKQVNYLLGPDGPKFFQDAKNLVFALLQPGEPVPDLASRDREVMEELRDFLRELRAAYPNADQLFFLERMGRKIIAILGREEPDHE